MAKNVPMDVAPKIVKKMLWIMELCLVLDVTSSGGKNMILIDVFHDNGVGILSFR